MSQLLREGSWTVVGSQRVLLGKKLGGGTFGEVYLAVWKDQKVAIKFERKKSHDSLTQEHLIYSILHGRRGTPVVQGIPRLRYFERRADPNALVLEELGPDLKTMFQYCEHKFSLKTVLMLADQMLRRLEYVHSKCIIHRDLKPENFVMGRYEKCHVVYMIDFGASKLYQDTETGRHVPYRRGQRLFCTARYASLNNHQGIEPSRRDDLETLGYIFVYFLRGHLPWQYVQSDKSEHAFEEISEIKRSVPLEELCLDLPKEFFTYLSYCRNLRFCKKPDYSFLRSLFTKLLSACGMKNDYCFDWIGRKHQQNMAQSRKTCAEEEENTEEYASHAKRQRIS